MEAFSLLKYWRPAGSATTAAATNGGATTIVTTVASSQETDEGPFFDLEFSVPVDSVLTESTGTESDGEVSPSDSVSQHDEMSNGFARLMLKFKKNKENPGDKTCGKKEKSGDGNSKFFTVKFKMEDIAIKSVFKRDNSSKSCPNTHEKKFSKDVMNRYLKMVSKRYGERTRFSGEAAPPCTAAEKGVRKGLGKSRSAPETEAAAAAGRRDDSLVQQEDGIQSAILHCKRSFNSSRDSEMSILSRSVSDPLHMSNKQSEQHEENDL